MAKHKPGKDTSATSNREDDVAGTGNTSVAGPQDVQPRPSRASKLQAKKAWNPLVPRPRKSSQQDHLDPEDDEVLEEHVPKKSKPAKSANLEKQYRPPDIDLDTDNDAEDRQPVKKKNSAVSSKSRKHQDGQDEHSPAPARDHSRTNQKSAKKAEEVVDEESSGSGGDDEYKPDEEDEGEESSEESELEDLVKDKEALERQFRDEAPVWADEPEDAPVEDSVDAFSESSHFPPPDTDPSDDDAGDHGPHAKPRDQHCSSSANTSKKKRAKGSIVSSGSEEEVAQPPPKKKKTPPTDKSHTPAKVSSDASKSKHKEHTGRGHGGKLDKSCRGSASGSQSGGQQKRVDHNVAKADKAHSKVKAPSAAAQSHKTAASAHLHVKRKRVKVDENVSWADGSDAEEDADSSSQIVKRRRAHESDDSALSNSDSDLDGGNDSGIEVVLPVKGHLKLTDQHRRVKRVVSTAIQEVLIIVCTKDAFPEGSGDTASYARRALINAAKSFDDKEMLRRLKSEEKEYWQRLASIVTQRMSNLRGKVKKATDSTPSTLFNVKKGDAVHVAYLQEGLRYVYPHDRAIITQKDTVDGTQPFVSPIFGQVIASIFFRCPRSLGYRLVPYFTSSLPDKPDEKEIPAALLALISTGLYASIDDYRHLPYRCKDFTVNANLEAYKQNIDELSDLKSQRPVGYHKLMHGLYLEICGGGLSGGPKPPRRSFLNTSDMVD